MVGGSFVTRSPMRKKFSKPRASTSTMPSFNVTCRFSKDFSYLLSSNWGGSKSSDQATQIARRVLKLLRFCYPAADLAWEITDSAIDSSIACTRQFIDFMDWDRWKMGYTGTIAYINVLGNAIDFRKSNGGYKDMLNVVEILLSRTRKSLSEKMCTEWNTTLDFDYSDKLVCWASLDEMQSVLPYHQPRFTQIIYNR